MSIDPRLSFVKMAVHALVELGQGLDNEEAEGLNMILDDIIIDWRDDHDGLQKRL